MNLVSYEYVACQDDHNGVLVLSEFTGAAQALGAGCVRVNPYNIEELARGMLEAIQMDAEQRAELHAYASQYVSKFTSQAWAQNFIASLEEQDPDGLRTQTSHGHPLPVTDVLAAYTNATRRLLVLGVGGTFLPATGATANDNVLFTAHQEALLTRLLLDPANTVLLTSGRSRSRMDELMRCFQEGVEDDGRIRHAHAKAGDAPSASGDSLATGGRLWAMAESGTFARVGGGSWETTLQAAQSDEWLDPVEEVRQPPRAPVPAAHVGARHAYACVPPATRACHPPHVRATRHTCVPPATRTRACVLGVCAPPRMLRSQVFRYFEERTPGSRVERRDRTIRWAYGAADANLGAQQASNLVEHLEKLLGDAPVERSWEGTCVEVRPHGSSCGHGLTQLLTADFAAAEAAEAAYSAAGGAGNAVPRGFDFVLGLGNFSARDEDLFLQLHGAEARPDWAATPTAGSGGQDGFEAADEYDDADAADDDDDDDDDDNDEAALEAPSFAEAEIPPEARPRSLDVAAGGVFTVVLGNRSTHARYFLPTEVEATQLLEALAITEQSAEAAADTAEQMAVEAAAAAAVAVAGGADGAAASPSAQAAAAAGESDRALPSALDHASLRVIAKRIARCWTPAFCLDYDGTLSPMVADPAAARLPPGTRALLGELSDRHPTAIVSGRSMEKLQVHPAWDRSNPTRPNESPACSGP